MELVDVFHIAACIVIVITATLWIPFDLLAVMVVGKEGTFSWTMVLFCKRNRWIPYFLCVIFGVLVMHFSPAMVGMTSTSTILIWTGIFGVSLFAWRQIQRWFPNSGT